MRRVLVLVALLAGVASAVFAPKDQVVHKKDAQDQCKNCCSEKGFCASGKCHCDIGYVGEGCERTSCEGPNGAVCSGHGECDATSNTCACTGGFKGIACQLSGGACYKVNGVECNGHGTCFNAACKCSNGWDGIGCERDLSKKCNKDKYKDPKTSPFLSTGCKLNATDPEDCSGHGDCNVKEMTCECTDKWSGKFCDQPYCPNECSNRGKCIFNSTGSRCECDPGFSGADCSSGCPFSCSGRGECLVEDGAFKCKCDEGFTGDGCQKGVCIPACSANGHCEVTVNGGGPDGSPRVIVGRKCKCNDGFSGHSCDKEACHRDDECHNGGKCLDKECQCKPGYVGSFCDKHKCQESVGDLANCSKAGTCQDDGTCACFSHRSGLDCEKLWCSGNPNAPKDCNGRGKCVNGPTGDVECACEDGFRGILCEVKTCPNDCSGHGMCHSGNCSCTGNWTGPGCERLACPLFHEQECAGPDNGECVKGECVCKPGYVGAACQAKPCQNDCSGHGSCSREGKCQCVCDKDSGCFVGDTCATQTCPSASGKMCGAQGACVAHKCMCYGKYSGFACDKIVCPMTTAATNQSSASQCSGHGKCNYDSGLCACQDGWGGTGCQGRVCDNDCSGHGTCNSTSGYCYCEEGFTGSDCNSLSCPNDCHARGTCSNGRCNCKEGWWREDCSERTCKEDCSMNGVCSDGECLCNPGRAGKMCELVSVCPMNCSGHGTCKPGAKMGECVCSEGWCGADCNTKLCLNDCSGHGECRNGTCACFYNQEQPAQCNLQQPNDKCSNWFNDDCSELTCPFKCHMHGKCDNGTCRCNWPYAGKHCKTYCNPDSNFYCQNLCDKSCKNRTRTLGGKSSESGAALPGLATCTKVCLPKCLEKLFNDHEPAKPECTVAALKAIRGNGANRQLTKRTAVHEMAEGTGDTMASAIEGKPSLPADEQTDPSSL